MTSFQAWLHLPHLSSQTTVVRTLRLHAAVSAQDPRVQRSPSKGGDGCPTRFTPRHSRIVDDFGGLDVLVNHAGTQFQKGALQDITEEQLRRTFEVNVFALIWTTQAALRHMEPGSSIINTSSVTGLRGKEDLLDYSASKGAVTSFTYALAQSLIPRGIRVNAVAPGPVWTPLIPATFSPERVEKFGSQVPMARAADPDEIAPSYVFLASNRLSSYYSGEVIAPIGGQTLPG